jgi:hypothetical protein
MQTIFGTSQITSATNLPMKDLRELQDITHQTGEHGQQSIYNSLGDVTE